MVFNSFTEISTSTINVRKQNQYAFLLRNLLFVAILKVVVKILPSLDGYSKHKLVAHVVSSLHRLDVL